MGKALVARAIVSKRGYTSRVKVIRYGTVAAAFTPTAGKWFYGSNATNLDPYGDIEQSFLFDIAGGRLYLRSGSAVYNGTTPVYVDFPTSQSDNQISVPVTGRTLSFQLSGVQTASYGHPFGPTGVLTVNLTFTSASTAEGSITITDAERAPNGATFTFTAADGGPLT